MISNLICADHDLWREQAIANVFNISLNQVKFIADGSCYSKVYKVTLHSNTDPPIAIKMIPNDQTSNPIKEASRKFHHRNILQSIDPIGPRSVEVWIPEMNQSKTFNLLPYEYIAKGSLKQYCGRVNALVVTKMLYQAADALFFMFQGVQGCCSAPCLHRDVTVDNILVRSISQNDIDLVLSDFSKVQSAQSFLQRQQQEGVHSVSTMDLLSSKTTAPEVVQFGDFSDKSDIYSLGVCALQLLLGISVVPSVIEPSSIGAMMHQKGACSNLIQLVSAMISPDKQARPTYSEILQVLSNELRNLVQAIIMHPISLNGMNAQRGTCCNLFQGPSERVGSSMHAPNLGVYYFDHFIPINAYDYVCANSIVQARCKFSCVQRESLSLHLLSFEKGDKLVVESVFEDGFLFCVNEKNQKGLVYHDLVDVSLVQ